MSKIFISHSSKDNIAAQAMGEWLTENGFAEFFLDLDPGRGIQPGEHWEKALHAAANRCEAVVFLISKNWLASDWCDREFALARSLNKNLFSVIIDHGLELQDLKPQFREAWQVVNLAAGQDGLTREATLPGRAVSGHVTWSQSGLRRLRNGLDKSGLDAKYFKWPPDSEPSRAPYRGLLALEERDAAIFFGREADIVQGADRLRRLREGAAPRMLVFLGASGAGKSSFLRAGLLARLRRDEANFLPLAAIRPGRDAMTGDEGLLGALVQLFPKRPRANLRAALAKGVAGVRPLLAELAEDARKRSGDASGQGKPPAILIAVDQAEELFRVEGAKESGELLAILRALVETDDPVCIVLFAIRSDSYDRLEHAREFAGLIQGTQPLLPLPRGNYRNVIEGPAQRAAEAGARLEIDPQLTARLLADVDHEAGADALPLLAFTLQQLYQDHGASGRLTLADYEAFGAIGGSIDRAVERAFRRVDADPGRFPVDQAEREALLRRGLVPWLAGIDPDTRSPRRNIARASDIPEEAKQIVGLLVEERLLVADRQSNDAGGFDDTLEPAHEALLRKWGLLKGWLEADLGQLATLEALRRAVRDWDANGRKQGWLAHQGERLADARLLDARPDIAAQLDARDRTYLAACGAKEAEEHAAREKARLDETARFEAEARVAQARAHGARRIALVAALAALGLAGLGGWAWTQKIEAQKQRDLAQLHHSQFLTSAAEQEVANSDFTTGALLALEAISTVSNQDQARPSAAPEAILFKALSRNRELIDLVGHELPVALAAFSPSGSEIVSPSVDGVWIWDAASGAIVRKLKNPGGKTDYSISSAEFTPDGRRLMIIGVDAASLWDANTGESVSQFSADLAWFSADGKRLIVASKEGIYQIDTETRERFELDVGHGSLLSGAFSRDGRLFVASNDLNTVTVWNLQEKRVIARFVANDTASLVEFNSNGSRVVTASNNGRYRVFDVESMSVVADSKLQLVNFPPECNSVHFSSDGGQILIVSNGSNATLWDFDHGIIRLLGGHKEPVSAAAFSPDGKLVVTASKDNTAKIWDTTSGLLVATLAGHSASVNQVRFSLDGTKILTTSNDNTIRVWKANDPEDVSIFKGGTKLRSATISSDGYRVAAIDESGVGRVWDSSDLNKFTDLLGKWTSVAFDATGARVAFGAADGGIRIVDFLSHATLAVFQTNDGEISSLAFGPDGHVLASGSDAGIVRFWSDQSGDWRRVGKEVVQNSGVVVTEFDATGLRIVTGSYSGSIFVIDVLKHEINFSSQAYGQPIRAAAFSPDGSLIVTGSDDNAARVWDAKTGNLNSVLEHKAAVYSVRFDAKTDRLMTASKDGFVRMWDSSKLGKLKEPDTIATTRSGDILSGSLRKDSNKIIVVGEDGNIEISSQFSTTSDLVTYAKSRMPRTLSKQQKLTYFIE